MKKNYQHDYNKVFKFSVFKYKLENENNIIPSIYEFKSHMKSVKHNDQIDECNNDERICKSTAIIQYNNSDDNSNTSKKLKWINDVN